MHANPFNAFLGCPFYHCLEVVNMGMHVAVAEKADKMKRGVVTDAVLRYFGPAPALEQLSAFYGLIHQLGAL